MKIKPESSTLPPLPQGFAQSLAPLLKDEMQDFLRSYEMPWQRGIRKNPGKVPQGGLEAWVEGLLGGVPWENSGRYITLASPAGLHPLHEAGAYYLQEPSAMAAVAALDPKPNEWVLDLCAAPGGKSTQIAARMQGNGLLVSNEPVASRAQVLSGSLERMGVHHALITCETPERLHRKWSGCFDRVLVDAPCSGEGMFRRHPETRTEWTAQTPSGCAKRQAEILESGAKMVRDGGILCYSTCTFNAIENEGVVDSFLKAHAEFDLAPFSLSQELKAHGGMLHLFPHKVAGEGHFIALMKKRGEKSKERHFPIGTIPLPGKESLDFYQAFCMENFKEPGPEPAGLFAGRLVIMPFMPDISGLKVLRAGLHLGESRGRHFIPDHAWAMSGLIPEGCLKLSLTLAEAEAYLRGETLPAPEGVRGWAVMRLAGLPLGWGKITEGRVQNHYPKGLRKG